MASNRFSAPSSHPHLTWKSIQEEDRAHLQALLAAHDTHTEAVPVTLPPAEQTLCAITPEGQMIACSWFVVREDTVHENRFIVFGQVHPEYRGQGLGRFLLQWTEVNAALWRAQHQEQRPGILRIEFSNNRPDAERLYRHMGFEWMATEYQMYRDLTSPLPDVRLPDTLQLQPWSDETASPFYEVYEDAWTTRPPHKLLTVDEWIRDWEEGDDDFRPDLSFLAIENNDAIGFIICEIDKASNTGWIAKLGVRPCSRQRGLGSNLLLKVMHLLQAEGVTRAALDVGADNPTAKRVYEQMGFVVESFRTVYKKNID